MALTRVQLVLGVQYLTAVFVVYLVQRILTRLERLLRTRIAQTRRAVKWSEEGTRQCSSSLPAEGLRAKRPKTRPRT
jgi:hypothetical protein